MVEILDLEDDSHRKIIIILTLLMIALILIFFAWSYSIVERNVLRCSWERIPHAVHSSDQNVDSNITAKNVFLEFKDVPSEASIEIRGLGPSFWEIEIVKNDVISQKYGINSAGNIYRYEENCVEVNKTLTEGMDDMFGRFNESL